jgi:hypothetical protein
MPKALYYVQVRQPAASSTFQADPFLSNSVFPSQLPVVAGSFWEALDRVKKTYPSAIILGVTIAEPTSGMAPIL